MWPFIASLRSISILDQGLTIVNKRLVEFVNSGILDLDTIMSIAIVAPASSG